MIGNSISKNLNNKCYKSMVQAISRCGGYFATKVGALCTHFFYMGSLMRTQVENSLNKLFNFQGHTIDVSDQAVLF